MSDYDTNLTKGPAGEDGKIRPSPELLAIVRRWHQAVMSRKTGHMADFLTPHEALRFIGTAKNEYWSGSVVREGVAEFFAVVPDLVSVEEVEAEAYECGETGWAAIMFKVQFAGQPEPTFQRETYVFLLEGANWKIIQRHGSVPVPNEVHMGIEQTAIQRLVDAVREETPALDQTEGLASVLFTDVESSTELAAALGDTRWSAIINAHFRDLEEIVHRHRGQFVKSLGDGTLSSFASAKHALSAAMDMQAKLAAAETEPHLGLRIGIHTGDVVQARGDFFGAVVNKAARITSAAGAGEIFASEATRAMVGNADAFRFAETVSLSLKGLEGQHLIHRLEWQA